MKHPQNKEEAEAAIRFYEGFHSNGLPDLSINIIREVDTDGGVEIVDIEFYKTLERCHDAHVFIKRLHFETGAMDEDVNPIDIMLIDLEDFIAASDAIKAYASIMEKKGGAE